MIRFDQIVEEWASVYKPMRHIRGGRGDQCRFFLTDSYYGMADLMREISTDSSPCVVMESNQEGTFDGGIDNPHYSLYFFCMAKDMSDGRQALEAKLEAKMHAQKFIAYIRDKQYKETPGFRNLNLDRIEYMSIGPVYDGWYALQLTLTDVVQYTACVNKTDYV